MSNIEKLAKRVSKAEYLDKGEIEEFMRDIQESASAAGFDLEGKLNFNRVIILANTWHGPGSEAVHWPDFDDMTDGEIFAKYVCENRESMESHCGEFMDVFEYSDVMLEQAHDYFNKLEQKEPPSEVKDPLEALLSGQCRQLIRGGLMGSFERKDFVTDLASSMKTDGLDTVPQNALPILLERWHAGDGGSLTKDIKDKSVAELFASEIFDRDLEMVDDLFDRDYKSSLTDPEALRAEIVSLIKADKKKKRSSPSKVEEPSKKKKKNN